MDRYEVEVIPGVTSVTAAAAAAGTPLCSREDVMTVLSGTMPEEELEKHLSVSNSAVIMKVGRHLPKIRNLIEKLGCLQSSVYVERALNVDQKVMGLSRLEGDIAPYFSIILFFRDSE
jgi:precorrin-2/cobalt-factor-2 C20-methyltransferase